MAKRIATTVGTLVAVCVILMALVLLTEEGRNFVADFGKAKKQVPEAGWELKFRYQKSTKHLPVDFTEKCCVTVLEDFDLQLLESLSDDEGLVLGTTHIGTLRLSLQPSLGAAKGLAHHQGGMFFSGSASFPDDVLIELAKSVGPLSVPMTSLSPAVSQAFGKHIGDVYMNDLKSFSVVDAKNFAHHPGELFVQNAKFAPGAAEILVDHPGSIYIHDLSAFPWEVAEKMIREGQRLSFLYDRSHIARSHQR